MQPGAQVVRRVAAALLVVAGLLTTGGPAGAGGGEDPAARWNAARRAAAVPRDLVIDARGLGYMRQPDGTLVPYGHDTGQVYASPSSAKPNGAPGGATADTEPPSVTSLDPAAGDTIGSSHTFSAVVTDNVGVRSVSFVIVYPGGTSAQSFSPSASGTTWTITLNGFTDGGWSWYVVATDTAKRGGNKTTSDTTPFTVSTSSGGGGGGGGGTDVVTNAAWPDGLGDVQTASGRVYFEMPANRKLTRWQGYVCSGTAVADGTAGRSLVLTAAHCVYDDANKAFARNVLFIPDQDHSTSGSDRDCSNDPMGCWASSFGVVDGDWATRTFPDNVAWDYGFYVVADSGAHSGTTAVSDTLDLAVPAMPVDVTSPATEGTRTDAIGYSYSEDPNLMYCSEALGHVDAVDFWLPSCALTGGSSGGPWLLPAGTGDGPIVSLNSWGYTDRPGMAGPKLGASTAGCVLGVAQETAFVSSGGVIAC